VDTKPRRARKITDVVCVECGKPRKSFRSHTKYCGATCKAEATNKKKQERRAFLDKYGHKCFECESSEGRMFLRVRPGPDGEPLKAVLCGRCNSAYSRSLFRKRVPAASKGYARRKQLSRKANP